MKHGNDAKEITYNKWLFSYSGLFLFFELENFKFPLLLRNSTFVLFSILFCYFFLSLLIFLFSFVVFFCFSWQENSERIPFSIYIHIKIFYGNTLKLKENQKILRIIIFCLFVCFYRLICCCGCFF